jgi:hypothetical protein
MRARSAWTSQVTRLRALSRPACSHREDGASVRGREERVHLGGVWPVRRPACADRLGPVMDPGLAAGGVHPGAACDLPKQAVVATLRSELLGVVVAVRPPKRSLHSCLTAVMESGRPPCGGVGFPAPRAAEAARFLGIGRRLPGGPGPGPRGLVPLARGLPPSPTSRPGWWCVTVISDVRCGIQLVPVSGYGLRFRRPPRCRDVLRFRRSWASFREQSASGPCSTGESVAFPRRCQRRNALSFHGLCSPSRSSLARSSVGSGFLGLPCGRLRSPAPASGSLEGSAAVREVPLAVARVAARRVCPGRVSHRRGGSGRPRACASGWLSPSVRCGPSWGS